MPGKAQWLARVEALPENVDVLEGADFFMIRDRPLAQELLEQARDLEPKNPKWIQKLALLHRLNASSGRDRGDRSVVADGARQRYGPEPADDAHRFTGDGVRRGRFREGARVPNAC